MISVRRVLLVEPATFPKGVLSLSIPSIATFIPTEYDIVHLDFNMEDLQVLHTVCTPADFSMVGLKVSCQNYDLSVEITDLIRKLMPECPIVWGGEMPSLLPDTCKKHADSVVQGEFGAVAEHLFRHLKEDNLAEIYHSPINDDSSIWKPARLSVIKNIHKYADYMGWPMETSQGCDKKCTFCMVHSMQPCRLVAPLKSVHEQL